MVSRISKEQAAEQEKPKLERQSTTFVGDLAKATARAGLKAPFEFTEGGDLFPQDMFEPMFTSMPAPGGRPHGMRVLFRSHQVKGSSLELYKRLRGPDMAVVELTPDGYQAGDNDGLDSMGNLETIPPYSHNGRHYPAGRVIMGKGVNRIVDGGPTPGETGPGTAPGGEGGGGVPASGSAIRTAADKPKELIEPSPAVQTFLKSQGMQDPLLLDSSFTAVQHVDEFIQFLPAATTRGWRVAIADPDAGMKLLRDAQAAGHGKLVFDPDGVRLKTLDDFLDDEQNILARDNAKAAKVIGENLELIKRETGVTDAEVVRVPALFGTADLQFGDQSEGPDGIESPMLAAIPAAINGIVLGQDRYLSTKQFGPVINGKDIFGDAVAAAYRSAGMKVSFIDGSMYTPNGGEIHCGTNTLRDASKPWWRKAPRTP